MCRKLVFIIGIILSMSIIASAQGDTARTTTPKSKIMPSKKEDISFPELFRAIKANTLPIPRKYADLAWEPQKTLNLFDSTQLHLSLNFGSPQTIGDLLREKPLTALLLVTGAVAGMMNHQVMGIDKEIEIKTMQNIYSRTPIPESARRSNNSFNTDK